MFVCLAFFCFFFFSCLLIILGLITFLTRQLEHVNPRFVRLPRSVLLVLTWAAAKRELFDVPAKRGPSSGDGGIGA